MEQVGFPAAELSNRGGSFSFSCILSMRILRRLSPPSCTEALAGCSIFIGVGLMRREFWNFKSLCDWYFSLAGPPDPHSSRYGV